MIANTRTAVLTILSILVLAPLAGCRLQRQFPPQPVQVTGTSDQQSVAPQVMPPEPRAPESPLLAGRTISAMASAEAPAAVLDPLPARLAAKEKARQEARRSLARQIEAIELEPGRTIADVIREDETKRAELERLLREARQEDVVRAGEGRYTVTLSIETSALRELFELKPPETAPPPSTAPPVVPGPSAELRKRAEADAVAQARARTLEFLKTVRTVDGVSLGELMAANRQFEEAVRDHVESAPPHVEHAENGVCQAVIALDLANVRRILTETTNQPQARWRPVSLLRRR